MLQHDAGMYLDPALAAIYNNSQQYRSKEQKRNAKLLLAQREDAERIYNRDTADHQMCVIKHKEKKAKHNACFRLRIVLLRNKTSTLEEPPASQRPL